MTSAGQLAAAKTWLKSVAGSLPRHHDDIEGMLTRLDTVNTIAESVDALGKTGERDQARFILEFKFEPALVDAQTSMNRLIDILGGENKVTTEAAAETKALTYRLLMAVLVGGTLATVLVAMALTQRTIALPLQRLAEVMRQIAQGEFGAPIEGLRRGDEVGTMTRAVLVFRDNGIALREAQTARARAREQAAAEKRAALEQFAASFESRILTVAEALIGRRARCFGAVDERDGGGIRPPCPDGGGGGGGLECRRRYRGAGDRRIVNVDA